MRTLKPDGDYITTIDNYTEIVNAPISVSLNLLMTQKSVTYKIYR